MATGTIVLKSDASSASTSSSTKKAKVPELKKISVTRVKGKDQVYVTIHGSEKAEFYRAGTKKNLKNVKWSATKSRRKVKKKVNVSKGDGEKTLYAQLANGGKKEKPDAISKILKGSIKFITSVAPVLKRIKAVPDPKKDDYVVITIYGSDKAEWYRTSNKKGMTGVRWRATKGRKDIKARQKVSKAPGQKTVYAQLGNGEEKSPAASKIAVTKVKTGKPKINPPVFKKFKINNGAKNTSKSKVTLILDGSGNPKYYRASEKKNFAGSKWKTFKKGESPTLILSKKQGKKTVYVQLGTGDKKKPSESNTLSVSIELLDAKSSAPVLSDVKINRGKKSTTTSKIKVSVTAKNNPKFIKIAAK
ncbi:MAG: hypothetical protein JKX97_02540, partial [Candidatus Lindowbacteria bacterium]|nr:hypothetical protein [Candidatus Lindowbacteria bacterium]